MKVIEEQHEVHTSGQLIEVNASIKATSKAFHVLSSHLYSDKILAIVRELSCNAWDSHISAGKSDLPIDVHLPCALDPTFFVRDFGLGMSDFDIRGGYTSPTGEKVSHEEGQGKVGYEQFTGVYTTFFDSTKTDSNDVIGQLGLGSKSPYAYAHTFTVESRFNGQKRIYTCYKNARNEPAITLMNTEATDESNGMTVSMAVKLSDIDKFSQAARKALMYFKPRPNVLGQPYVIPFKLEHTLSGTNWKVRNTDYYAHMNGAYVVQGFVPYPVDTDQLEQNGLSSIAASLAGTDVDLYVPIGDVEVAPSREALSYDQRTINNLILTLKNAANELRTSFQEKFDECDSAWEVAQLFDTYDANPNEKLREVFRKFHKDQPFEWEGTVATRTILLDLEDVVGSKIIKATRKDQRGANKLKINGTWDRMNDGKKFTFEVTCNTIVLIDSKAAGTNSKIAQYIANQPKKLGRELSVLIIRPTYKAAYSLEEMLGIVQEFGNPSVVYVDSLPDIPRARSSYVPTSARKRKELNQFMAWSGFRTKQKRRSDVIIREFTRSCWHPTTVDLDDGGIYVRVVKNSIMFGETDSVDLYVDQMIKAARALEIIERDAEIIGFTDKEIDTLDKDKWTLLDTLVKEEFTTDFVDNLELTKATASTELTSMLPYGFVSYFTMPIAIDKFNEGEFKTLLTDIREVLNAEKYDSSSTSALLGRWNIKRPTDDVAKELMQRFSAMSQTYKYFGLVSWGSMDNAKHQAIVAYVNEVDALHTNTQNVA